MLDEVREYYGKVLKSSDDLQTDACCVETEIPAHIKAALADIHDQVSSRYCGCGLIAPEALAHLSILDLGSGVCGKTYRMLQQSRFRPFFEFVGNGDTHYVIFPHCGTALPFAAATGDNNFASTGACC